jgi:cell division protein FtsL
MLDTVQLVLLFVIIIVSLLLVVLGVQVYFILKEVRKTITKANEVLTDAPHITESVSVPISSLSSLASGLKAGSIIAALKVAKSILSHDKEDSKE